MTTRKASGFTLLELITVVAIVAILATIALPSFADQLRKSRRSEAIGTLQEQQLRLERWRVDNDSYGDYALPSDLGGSSYYDFDLDGGPTSYTLLATPKGNQAKDPCGELKLTFASGVSKKEAATSGCW